MIKGEYEKESKHDCRELVSECKREREKRREGGGGRERSRPTSALQQLYSIHLKMHWLNCMDRF